MIRYTGLIFFLLLAQVSLAQIDLNKTPAAGKNKEAFIPKGCTLLSTVEEDFNKDNLIDQAIVIEQNKAYKLKGEDCVGKERHAQVLLILFKRVDGNYKVSLKTQQLFINDDCEDYFRFETLGKRNKTLQIVFADESIRDLGSKYYCYFRFQNNDWYLIGYTSELTKVTEPDMGVWGSDINLVTGVREDYKLINKPNSDKLEGPKKVTKKSKKKPKPLIALSALKINTSEWVVTE
jgi:hypothetical protein